MTNPNDHNVNHHASSPRAYWAGWLALAFATAGMILICMGDPFWLGLPSSAIGVLAGRHALRRGQDNHVGAHLGFNIGFFNLFFLWPLLIVLVQYVFEIDVSSLFQIPSYD